MVVKDKPHLEKLEDILKDDKTMYRRHLEELVIVM